jgi:septal ring factor EnvC (AmiA/AmiB activator)
MAEQEPLFPTSQSEREDLMEKLVDILQEIHQARKDLKDTTTKMSGDVAKLEKQEREIQRLLVQSRPRKPPAAFHDPEEG